MAINVIAVVALRSAYVKYDSRRREDSIRVAYSDSKDYHSEIEDKVGKKRERKVEAGKDEQRGREARTSDLSMCIQLSFFGASFYMQTQ